VDKIYFQHIVHAMCVIINSDTKHEVFFNN